MKKNLFLIGLDPFHLEMVRKVRHAEDYLFHGLLDYDEVITPAAYPFDQLLAKAEHQLAEFPGTVDAIIVHWDFPASTLLPILCRRLGLRSASLESVLKCEHKYWARLEQQRAIPEYTPRFAAVDPFDDRALDKLDLAYPFWLKPVKSFASHLGFRIDRAEDFHHAIPIIRKRIPRLGEGFNQVLAHAALPPEVKGVDGYHCVAEEITEGKQCGVEGFVFEGKVAVHGIIDGVKDAHQLSFTRWEYPSVWPHSIQARMIEATERLMAHIGFDNSPFGVEFFWDEKTDRLWVLEVNTRISQSHSDQFIKVEGVSNHEVAIDVALGRQPEFGFKEGNYACAAKFMLRKYHDATVTRIPSAEEIQAIEGEFPDSRVVVLVEAGKPLSILRDQDSYSFEIANIFLGAQSQKALLANYRDLAQRLRFEFSDGRPVEEWQFDQVKY
ncbi:ATP-grasp domain-containing protein [Methylohalobius crimeensis]|uniref:ATP-grasp domain-containing protein n=1 Tax=Methylohalobius crimeensis TaxID=244365 RepID=UPI0003B35834|nr:ATP-grasp domain-containing protein [Methylohalobius crimeensis]